MSENSAQSGVRRREFLKILGAGTATTAAIDVAGADVPAAPGDVPE